MPGIRVHANQNGWQFTAAEWIGGLVLIVIMTVLVKLTYPKELVEEARRHVAGATGHAHGPAQAEGATIIDRLRNPQTRVATAQNVAMDVSMLWKDLLGGFLIAGFLAAFVGRAGSRSFNDTFWLNVVFGLLGIYLWRLNAGHPMMHGASPPSH
jgi:uncharacterized membrane protein YraQ (UPF0718 family)